MSTTTVFPRKRSLPATVFVVDDDRAVLRRVTRESLRTTNLGVLTADTLSAAADYVSGGKFAIGAILADLDFRKETQDPEHNLYDGLSLVKYIQETRPEIPIYVLSMNAEDPAMQKIAKEMGLNIRGWYDKLRPASSQFSPWMQIERDIIIDALKSESSFRKEAQASGENPVDLLTDEKVAEKVRSIFNYPRLTYLQILPYDSPYVLKKPIEVHCWLDPNWTGDDKFRATAIQIPLLLEARGTSVTDAIDCLAELLVEEMRASETLSVDNVVGYGRFIKQRLDEHLTPGGGELERNSNSTGGTDENR